MRQFYITAGGCLTTCTPLHLVLCSFEVVQILVKQCPSKDSAFKLPFYTHLPYVHICIQIHIICMKLCFDNILKIILYSRNSGQASILLKYSWMAKSINSLIKELFLVSSLLQIERNMEENSFRDHLRNTLAK